MNYIGSKIRLTNFIKENVYSVVGQDLSKQVFCDLFAGTGVIGRSFKDEVKTVISNDMEYYAYVINRCYIGGYYGSAFLSKNTIRYLNNFPDTINDGFIFNEYSENGSANRLYFSEYNGKKIDTIRTELERLYTTYNKMSDDVYYCVLCSLLESADKVANTASIYGAYLKKLKKSAQKELVLSNIEIPNHKTMPKQVNYVYNENANDLIKRIDGDILYLDPPYNHREYGANYHLLNTIAKYDKFVPKGKTGLREYQRSSYCKKGEVLSTFDDLIRNANFKYIFLSYNNEGLMSEHDIRTVMERYGRYDLTTTEYTRFKADKSENRTHKANNTTEYLHILEKS